MGPVLPPCAAMSERGAPSCLSSRAWCSLPLGINGGLLDIRECSSRLVQCLPSHEKFKAAQHPQRLLDWISCQSRDLLMRGRFSW